MPAGVALGGPERRRGGSDGESAGHGERARPVRAIDGARAGAQNVGNTFAEGPADFDPAGHGRAFGGGGQRTDGLERLADQGPGVPRADEIAETVCQNAGGIVMKPDSWTHLTMAARRAAAEPPAEMPFAFDTRVIADSRRRRATEETLPWALLLRGALVCAGLILLLSVAANYQTLKEREPGSVAIADSAMRLSMLP